MDYASDKARYDALTLCAAQEGVRVVDTFKYGRHYGFGFMPDMENVRYIIVIHPQKNPSVRLALLAHELGHWFNVKDGEGLPHLSPLPSVYVGEREANKNAIKILERFRVADARRWHPKMLSRLVW